MNNRKIFFIVVIISILSSFFLLQISGKKLNSSIYNYVNIESKRLASNIVNYSINETIEKNLSDELFKITKNNQDEVEILDYNTKEVNRILKVVTKEIQKSLLSLEEGNIKQFAIAETFKNGNFKNIKKGVICEIPLGILKKNIFFSNFGPIIPVRMSFLGNVQSEIKTNITSYGFNSIVLEVILHVEIEEQVTMPTTSKKSIIEIDAPLTLKVVQGIVPEYYYLEGLKKGTTTYSTKSNN